MSYIPHFNEKYREYSREVKVITKQKLNAHKKKNHNFTYAYNKINVYFKDEISRFYPIEDDVFKKLFDVYQKRSDIYDAESLNLIIDRELQEEFERLKKESKIDHTYQEYLDILAKKQAYFQTNNKFKNKSLYFENLYDSNQLEEFENIDIFKGEYLEPVDVLNLENKFNDKPMKEVYDYFKKHLLDENRIEEEDLLRFIKYAFHKQEYLDKKIKLKKNEYVKVIKHIFHEFYSQDRTKKHGSKDKYERLLVEYFEGFKKGNFRPIYK
jgi:hypothetical protein